MATRSSVSGLCEQKYRKGIDHTLHTSVMQKQNRLGIKDNRPYATVQQHLLGMIQRTKSTGTTSAGVIQARVPNYVAISALQNRLPVDIIKEKLTVLIMDLWPGSDMALINEWVDAIVNTDGSIDQARYDELFSSDDPEMEKSLQYKDPKQVDTGFNSGDLKKFGTILKAAKGLVNSTMSERGLIYNVFGSKYSDAKGNYNKIGLKIEQIDQEDRVGVTTDYNGDDKEIGVGGYADFRAQEVHFMLKLLKDKHKEEGETTIIHECAHLIDNSIDDIGYFGTPGFENMSDDEKLHNAAHYEVVPKWVLKDKTYPRDKAFSYIPPEIMGIKENGERLTSEYFREAWDAAFNSIVILREYVDKPLSFAQETELKDFSAKMDLSIHDQTGPCQVTLLDVVLMERIVRKLSKMRDVVPELAEDVSSFANVDAVKEYLIAQILSQSTDMKVNRELLDYLKTRPYEHF